ncbi:MAG: hypothetical protein GOU97_03155 [Nanoarchaeota archaeon]|nr:hypothetical protein [Nanoarchaeota archaeon]
MNNKKIIIILLVATILPRLFLLHPTNADEVFYYNVAKQIAQGKVLYKDFFFAHPPIQPLLISLTLSLTGPEIWSAKILPLMSSTITVILLYLVTKKIYGQKTGIIASIILILSPEWLAYSTISHGFYTALMFALAGLYASQKKHYKLAGAFLSLAFLTRVSIILIFPILLLYEKKILKSVKAFIILTTLSVILIQVLTQSFISQNFLYHFSTKFAEPNIFSWQFWSMGFFFLGLTVVASFFSFKQKKEFLKSVLPFLLSLIILLTFWRTFYYYMIPFTTLLYPALSRTIRKNKDALLMTALLVMVSLYHNTMTINYYANPSNAQFFYDLKELFQDRNGTIFGDPVATNYVSFENNNPISFDFYDSFIQHVEFNKTIIELIEQNPPDYFITSNNGEEQYFKNYFDKTLKNYKQIGTFKNLFEYRVYELIPSKS